MSHISVLLKESIDSLDIKKGEVFVDGTLGAGGHSEEVARRFGQGVVMIALDLDPDAITRSKKRLSKYKLNIRYVEDSFRNIKSILKKLKLEKVDKILLDIGLSSNQFEDSGRGFSFQKDEPLIMSFRKKVSKEDLTAREIVNTWDAENIATILKNYGEEQFGWKIAKAIVARRESEPIETTFDLVEIIKVATPKWYHHRKIHPATKTFQALRITVNDEIRSLREGLSDGFEMLSSGGRLAVVSFHSLEDREVKRFIKEKEKNSSGKSLTKKPVTPGKDEVSENPRSRSAKLRVLVKN